MKETKITKKIFAVFVAFIVILLISCGDLQVFAAQQSVTFYNRLSNNRDLYAYSSIDDYSIVNIQQRIFASSSASINFNTAYNYKLYVGNNHHKLVVNSITGAELSTDPYNPTYLPPGSFIYILSATNSVDVYYYITFSNTTPTPDPTPTPEPTPTPVPTFNPDQPTYTTFFNHLLNDGNNALNALYLSWTSANNKFYTGIFFIGLPIMIGIFGIVASIFFGGDD